MRRPKYHYNETWKMNYYFCLGWSEKEYSKYMMSAYEHEVKTDRIAAQCLFLQTEECQFNLIWIRDKADIPALVHECLHAACNTLQLRGWIPDLCNEEPLTYLTEEIFKHAYKHI